LSIKLASEEEDSSPERSTAPFNDESRLKPRNNALMDEDCRKDLPPSEYMVVGGMNVDMMDMDMNEEERK